MRFLRLRLATLDGLDGLPVWVDSAAVSMVMPASKSRPDMVDIRVDGTWVTVAGDCEDVIRSVSEASFPFGGGP